MAASIKGRNFIRLLDFSKQDLDSIWELAGELKRGYRAGWRPKLLEGQTLYLLFYNRSIRTRNSFETGMFQLGGHANHLDSQSVYTPALEGEETALVTERVKDVARVLSGFGDAIAVRIYGKPCNFIYGRGNRFIHEFADNASVPVVNMECDIYHPCQGLDDVFTIKEKFGSNLRGLNVTMSWAYSPSLEKPLAIPHSTLAACSFQGMNITYARPDGIELDPKVLEEIRANTEKHGGTFREVNCMEEAFKGADVIYPKSWWSTHYVPPETKEPDFDGMKNLFDKYKNWICDEKMMALANKDAIYLHPGPADRGYEVTDAVIDGPQSFTPDLHENRMHVQKAMLSLIMGH
jgi:N-acetylornithine carbamoyltransferase